MCGSFFKALGLMIWPIFSVVLGIIVGSIFSVVMTVMVFGITLVRTPMHIAKTMYVTATTQECFKKCNYLDPFLRVAVFQLVPIPHILWLAGITLFSFTIGTLYYISKSTKMFFLHDYTKYFKKVQSNVKIEKESHLGEYINSCQTFMANDEESHSMINALKGICALIPGVPLGALPFIPFSIGVLLITIYRLPINFYKTMKIAIITVVLKWDLKLAACLMLPLAHIMSPLVAFVTALIGSLFYFIWETTESIIRGDNPFEKWYKLETGLRDYYQKHQEFVGENFGDRYDHPTGIPSGWQGESYGIPIQKILRWQWDLLVCVFLMLYGFPICLLGSVVIFGVKFFPGAISWEKAFIHEIAKKSSAEILGCWAFYIVAFFLIPVGALLSSLIATSIGTLLFFTIPSVYLEKGYKAGFYAPFRILFGMDRWDFFNLDGFYVLACLSVHDEEEDENQQSGRDVATSHNDPESRQKFNEAYWDRFANQCIRSTSNLIAKNWISLEDVQCMEPSVMQAIPAVAILDILVDTVQDADLEEEDILWKIDGTLCKGKDRPRLKRVATFFWPKVMETKKLLLSKNNEKGGRKAILSATANVSMLTAMICSNTDKTTGALKEFVKSQRVGEKGQPNATENGRIRAKLVELSLGILQVKPFQDRMTTIFEYKYSDDGGLTPPEGAVFGRLFTPDLSSLEGGSASDGDNSVGSGSMPDAAVLGRRLPSNNSLDVAFASDDDTV